MSNLEELIEKLCPDGVEYVKLNTICSIYDGTHSTPNYTDAGVKFASVENINAPYDTKKFIALEDYQKYKIKPQVDDVLMTRIGSIGVCYVIEDNQPLAYYVSLALLRPSSKRINSKYLKYVIESVHGKKELRKRTLVNAVPIKINKDDIGKIKLPVPPLEVQREIVRILDNFTFLTTELAAELAARQKQYEYYREYLFENHISDVEWKRLDELFPFIRNGFVGTIKSFFTNEIDGIRYLEGTNIHDGVISDNEVLYVTKEFHKKHIKNQLKADDILMVQSGHIGECAVVGKKYEGSNCHALIIMSNGGKCLSKYYVYYFHTIKGFKSLTPAITGGTIKHVLAGKVGKIKVPVPSLEQQKRIVDILDRFDTLCNDISNGLPAEIEARQKQYEYYRDKLLSFKELKKEA